VEGNDLAPWSRIGQGVIFEGVLAFPPTGGVPGVRQWLSRRNGDWESMLMHWKPNELSLKSMIDMVNRRGVQTQVFTFLAPEAVDPIERWLVRKGVSTSCFYYVDAAALAEDLRYNRDVHVIYTPDQDTAAVLGIRATVVSPNTVWTL